MKLMIAILRVVLRGMGLVKGDRYRYSKEYEDNYKYMDLKEKLWWAYKALIKQIEKAEKGKNIEEYFRSQDLNFEPKADFETESRLVLAAGGDVSCSEVIYPESTSYLWEDIEEFYFSADLKCANLESPLDAFKPIGVVPRVCLTAPNLNTSPEMFERYTKGGKGINFFSTANNHSIDQGESGLVATLDFLDSTGCLHVGTSRSKEEQMDIPMIEINGIRVAMLSYTYCLNGYDSIAGKEYMTNVIRLNKPDSDISLICEHVRIAHEKKADMIIAILHWSIEFEMYPIENIIRMGHRIMELGVDMILGGHPHVVQPMEKYRFTDPYTGLEKKGFIVYSLGEMVSYNAFSKNSRLGFVVKLEISKGLQNNTVRTMITKVRVLPVYTWIRRLENHCYDYRLLDFIKTVNNIKDGYNLYGFSTNEIMELVRLEALLYNRLLPENYKCLFENLNGEGITKNVTIKSFSA